MDHGVKGLELLFVWAEEPFSLCQDCDLLTISSCMDVDGGYGLKLYL
jgi:hypothetical protein